MLNNKERIKLAKLQHYKWLKRLGLNVDMDTGHIIKSRIDSDDTKVFTNEEPLVERNTLPTSDRVVGNTYKREYSTTLPEGKTISVAYNKGAYQVVDAKDFKTMGRKI